MSRGALRSGVLVAVGAMLVAIAARFDVPIPGAPVPQSLQTLAVVLVGALSGPRRGAVALALYIGVGAVGAPVFAGGASGVEHLVGPSAGYLVGFVGAAALTGWWWEVAERRRAWWALGAMVLGHVLILAFGWVRLAFALGFGGAFSTGVAPFLVGGLVKSAVAACVLMVWEAYWGRADRRPHAGDTGRGIG